MAPKSHVTTRAMPIWVAPASTCFTGATSDSVPCLGPWPYCRQHLYWCPWFLISLRAMLMSGCRTTHWGMLVSESLTIVRAMSILVAFSITRVHGNIQALAVAEDHVWIHSSTTAGICAPWYHQLPNIYQVLFSKLWPYYWLRAVLPQGPCQSWWPIQTYETMVSSGPGLPLWVMPGSVAQQ